jgi:hypothetical protein
MQGVVRAWIPKERWTTSPKAQQEVIVSDPDCNRCDRLRVPNDRELRIDFEAEVEISAAISEPRTSSQSLVGASRPDVYSVSPAQSILPAGSPWALRATEVSKHRDAHDQVLETMQLDSRQRGILSGNNDVRNIRHRDPVRGVCRDFCSAHDLPRVDASYALFYRVRVPPRPSKLSRMC